MNPRAFGPDVDYNHEFLGSPPCFDEDNDEESRNGNCLRESLSQEQLKCLEATFVKFMSQEVDVDYSNWEEFYELLNNACYKESASTSTFNCEDGIYQKFEGRCGESKPTEGFKINAEATKQQYRTDQSSSSKPSIFDQYPKEQAPDRTCNGKYDELNNTRRKAKRNNISTDQSYKDESREDYETVPNNMKSGKRKLSQNTKASKNKTNRMKNNLMTNDEMLECKKPVPTDSYYKYFTSCFLYRYFTSSFFYKYFTFSFLSSTANECYLNFLVAMSYLSLSFKWCWRKSKEIFLFLFCILLIVVVAVWRVIWFLLCVVFKVTLFIALWVLCKVLNVVYSLQLKYDIFGKMRTHLSNGCDLLFYITGINLKTILKRNKNETNNVNVPPDDEGVPPLPTSPDEAVEHLMVQCDKPFRALCVTHQSTNDEIKANYRKMALLVHPDKCLNSQADEAFKILDSSFKALTDPSKKSDLLEEEKRHEQWKEFKNRYAGFEEDFETMFNDLINSISCSKCHGKHKRTLVKDRSCFAARYCRECHTQHSANDGDIWAENNLFGFNWTCYVCMDGEVYELTEWAECQNLRMTIPINCHRVVCRLGNQEPPTNGNRRRNKQNSESTEPKKARNKKRKQKGRKP